MWMAILSSSDVGKGRPLGIRRLGQDLVFWRGDDGRVNALSDICPHRRTRLSLGSLVDGRIRCPYHGFEFDGSGSALRVPAEGRNFKPPEHLRAMSYRVHEEHGIVWIWYGRGQPDGPPRYLDDMSGMDSHSEYHETWRIPFPRAVENQLDVFHLPFVHHNTIGRGMRTLVNGPLVKKIDEYSFIVYPFNEVDVGQVPRRAEDLNSGTMRNYLKFIYPNLWENYISKGSRVVAFFAPIDGHSTEIYISFHLKLTGSGSLDRLLAGLAMPFNKYVLHQDRRVVEAQDPGIVGDRLVRADSPISMFRKMFLADADLRGALGIGGPGPRGNPSTSP
jgi:phenylpropionate dioxygenase-like ring-hydroxylating dioxygenase large terminal subunit